MSWALDRLLDEIRQCRVCRDTPTAGAPLPHEPRPVLRASSSARIAVCGQAPGTRVHASGVPFTDPSGVRLRRWMGVTDEEFYDARRIAIIPMGFCFPGQDAAGADLPPRTECAALWRRRVLQAHRRVELVLLVGLYAQRWHLPELAGLGVGAVVARWREIMDRPGRPRLLPLPHPSWRNNAWIKQNRWFEIELVPQLQAEVRALMEQR
jgi:uracil-DNA glycosylase